MTTRIKFRRDTAANWTEQNPTLALGEPGFEQDTNKLKIGDGETAWTLLDYASGGSDSLTSDHSVAITVGNTEYFAIVNRANNNSDGVEGTAVAYDSDNNIVTLHVSEIYDDYASESDELLIISKFDDTGALLWQKQIDQDIDNNQAHDLVIDGDDNIIVGVSADNEGDPDSIVLIKFDSSGEEIWQKDYTADGQYSNLELGAMVLSGTDIFVAADYEEDSDEGTGIIGLLMKVSATDGAHDWTTTIPNEFGSNAWGVDVTTSGDPVIVGAFGGAGPNAAMVIRFDGADGTEVWSKVLFGTDGSTSVAGGDIVIDSQNNIFVSVNSYQPIVHDDGDNTNVTIAHVAKLNSAGATQWIRRIGPGPCASVATGIDCDSTGNVYLAALTVAQDNPTREANDYYATSRNVLAIAKYSTSGAVLWQRYIETDSYEFAESRDAVDQGAPGEFDHAANRGRNMSIGLDGKLAVQVTVKQIDADDTWDNTRYWESITFQIDQDGREMTVGSGNEKFAVKASRIPGRFITIESELDSGNLTLSDISSNITVTNGTLTYSDGELAQQVAKSAPYAYVFGNDGTLTIPNDGDVRLTQTQIGWFSIFGPTDTDNSFDDIWIRANCVDTATGDVYVVGHDDDSNDGFVARYNSEGQIIWSVKLFDITDEYNTRCNAVKIHPVTGHVVVLAEYYGTETGALLLQIDPDTARVVTSTGFRDLDENDVVQACDLDFLSDGKIVVVGQKYDEYQSYSVTANTTVSTTGLLVFNRSDIAGKTIDNSNWYVTGSNISTRVAVDSVNAYLGLTGTVRQGSGATFTITDNGDGTYGVSAPTLAGTNYREGHKIKVLGTAIGGTTPANDCVVTVNEINSETGAITILGNVSGTAAGVAYQAYNDLSGANYLTGSGFAFDFYGDAANIYTEHQVTITNAGNNYVSSDTIVIPGTQLGGNTTAHDLTITVSAVDGNVTTINSTAGNAQTTTWHVRTTAQTPDFGNVSGAWSLQQPLSGEAFVYVGTAANANVAFGPVWTKTLSAGGTSDDERYFSVAVDASNNIYAAGEMIARDNVTNTDINNDWCAVVSKFNSAGTHQWTRALNIAADNASYAKSVAVQGNVVVVSHESNGNGTTVVTKLDATGAVKWQRQTASGDDSSVAIDTNGDIYAVAEASFESQYNDAIKVIKFNTYGEVIWRKILATHVGDDGAVCNDYFKNGRNLTLDADHLYISGYTTAFIGDIFASNPENGFMVKLPKSGDCDGIYGAWTIMTDMYDVDKVTTTEATAFVPNINTGEFETWEPDFETDWWDPSNNNYYHSFEEIRDRDGGAIEFADGTRQTSSAQMIPQKLISNGADHRLSLEDMGRHIYVTDSDTRIAVPYHDDNPLPVGFTVVIINNSGSSIRIDGDGGNLGIIVPGDTTAPYWDLASPGMATLIKVEEGDNNAWFMTGHVTEVI
jgi:outer membrane protein assembly factor BamB